MTLDQVTSLHAIPRNIAAPTDPVWVIEVKDFARPSTAFTNEATVCAARPEAGAS